MVKTVAMLLACVLFMSVIAALLVIAVVPLPAEARRACVGDHPGDWDDCHPEGGGEPASWCGQEHIQGPQNGCWCSQQQVAPPDDEGGWIRTFWHRFFGTTGGGGDPDYVATD